MVERHLAKVEIGVRFSVPALGEVKSRELALGFLLRRRAGNPKDSFPHRLPMMCGGAQQPTRTAMPERGQAEVLRDGAKPSV